MDVSKVTAGIDLEAAASWVVNDVARHGGIVEEATVAIALLTPNGLPGILKMTFTMDKDEVAFADFDANAENEINPEFLKGEAQ